MRQGDTDMKFETYSVQRKNGEVLEASVMVPETLKELLTVYPEERVYQLGLTEYLLKAKRKLKSGRRQTLKVRLDELTPEQQLKLRSMGLLK
jgi:hypothetical protein